MAINLNIKHGNTSITDITSGSITMNTQGKFCSDNLSFVLTGVEDWQGDLAKTNRIVNGNFEDGYNGWTFTGTGSYPQYWYKTIIDYNQKKCLGIGVDTAQTYTASQVVDFTSCTELSVFLTSLSGNESMALSFKIFIDDTQIFSLTYPNQSPGVNTFPVNYTGQHTLKLQVTKNGGDGNATWMYLTDVCLMGDMVATSDQT